MSVMNVKYMFCLCRAKIINTTLALRTTKYLSNEREYIPWESALRNLDYYILMFDRTEVYGALQVNTSSLPILALLILTLTGKVYERKLTGYEIDRQYVFILGIPQETNTTTF